MCKDVHEWTLEERKPIVLNEMGKPIGPDDKTVDKYTRFLGTLARNASLAPLNRINWHQVPDKDNIWEYVKLSALINVFKSMCFMSFIKIMSYIDILSVETLHLLISKYIQ